jgi:Collagen triple helix repeat (20 copies)
MKNFIILFSLLFTFSCKKGETGPQGPSGSKGETGDAGTNGTPGNAGIAGINGATGQKGGAGDVGATGNSNVLYTEWTKPILTNVFNAETITALEMKETSIKLDLGNAINTGLIYIYLKAKFRNYNDEKKEYELTEKISSNQYFPNFFLKIPGHTTNLDDDFIQSYISRPNTDIGKIAFSISLYKHYINKYDSKNNKYALIPEFVGQPLSFIKEYLENNSFEYRVVVIKGTQKGRQANINMNNYAEVKKALNLKD